jgi:type IV secretory pathway TrbF-like protein
METLCSELKVEIFRYVSTPISLILINRNWYSTSQDSHARAEWLIYKYGRENALFHAIRLGNNFITVEVVQVLLAKKRSYQVILYNA